MLDLAETELFRMDDPALAECELLYQRYLERIRHYLSKIFHKNCGELREGAASLPIFEENQEDAKLCSLYKGYRAARLNQFVAQKFHAVESAAKNAVDDHQKLESICDGYMSSTETFWTLISRTEAASVLGLKIKTVVFSDCRREAMVESIQRDLSRFFAAAAFNNSPDLESVSAKVAVTHLVD